jgi:hypothetical protein
VSGKSEYMMIACFWRYQDIIVFMSCIIENTVLY